MMIFSGNTVTEYGMTPAGQFFEKHEAGRLALMRVTKDPQRFLSWMIQEEVDRDFEERRRANLIKTIEVYWGLKYGDTIRGSFNRELYFKVIEAKKENGTLHR